MNDFDSGFRGNMFILILLQLSSVWSVPTNVYKDQYCTDPRTMKKYPAYKDWADAYSCTKHRCQPGGRNLAIYTVGCKRVEAPESAIECEEVVEDTNMEFPFCCTRLRCLVVVRGEVWTRVLGQPWETLPAAPWSHMYKMKKPPPNDSSFLPKNAAQGPVYELVEPEDDKREKVLRANKKTTTEAPDCNEVEPRALPAPDILIALTTSNDDKSEKKSDKVRHKKLRKTNIAEDVARDTHPEEVEQIPAATEKPIPIEASEEKYYENAYGVTQKVPKKKAQHQLPWTEIPQDQWSDHDNMIEPENVVQKEIPQAEYLEEKKGKSSPGGLQALVDAIGTRMRDIESVVQRMSEKVRPGDSEGSAEKRSTSDLEETRKRHKIEDEHDALFGKPKKPNPDGDDYKRFSVRNRSKYLYSTEGNTEQPLFVEDTNLNGYFSDASNNVVRRASPVKEPPPTYMAPVENHKRTESSEEKEKEKEKHKKHAHKKKHGKGKSHKKHHREEKRKKFNRLSSTETDKNAMSLEDSSSVHSS